MLCFSRNRYTNVDPIDEHTLKASCRLQDGVTDCYVEVMIKLPDLEISNIKAEVGRGRTRLNSQDMMQLKKVVGVRIGPGILKIIKGLIGNREGLEQPAFMVEECCQGVILYFTKDDLAKVPLDEDEERIYYNKMVKGNLNLYNRCAAFAPGSSFVEGIERS
jgi:hypothetical protein